MNHPSTIAQRARSGPAAPLATILFTLLLALAAQAALPPISDAQRLAQSEVVLTARIDTTSDQGLVEIKQPTDGAVRAVLHSDSASLTVVTAEKGELSPGDIVKVTYHQTVDGWPSPDGQNELLPGRGNVRVYLRKVSGSSSYELLQPNGWESLEAQ